MKKIMISAIIVFCSTIGFSQNVPENYQELYNTLLAKLNVIDSTLSAKWNGDKFCTNYCTSLFNANSSRGEVLLEPQVIEGIKIFLDALDSLSVSAIDLAIQYPILVESFPKSENYLNFYKQVVQEIRSRGFKLIIGCQSTFRDTVFGQLDVDAFYMDLTTERYKSEKKQMIETIITQLQPDYLTIETEPTTQKMNLGLDFSVSGVIEYIEYFLDGLNKNGVFIGAGSATWDEIGYIDAIAQQPEIDYIDFHIYPINHDYFVDKVFAVDSLARFYDKKLVIGECWLYKTTDAELGVVPPHVIFARDVFSFWIPLDSMFTECVVKLSHFSDIELTSLTWVYYFFKYIDYVPEHDNMPLDQLYNMAFTAATPNIISKTFSRLGTIFHSLITDACDSTNTSIFEEVSLPDQFILEQNYPNPFNPTTTIKYQLSAGARVSISVYNVLGELERTLVNQKQKAGNYSVNWDGKDNKGLLVSSGVYLCTIRSKDFVKTLKMILIR